MQNLYHPLAGLPVAELFRQDILDQLLNKNTPEIAHQQLNKNKLKVGQYVITFNHHEIVIADSKSPNSFNSIILDKENEKIIHGYHIKREHLLGQDIEKDITQQGRLRRALPIFKAIESVLAPNAIEKILAKLEPTSENFIPPTPKRIDTIETVTKQKSSGVSDSDTPKHNETESAADHNKSNRNPNKLNAQKPMERIDSSDSLAELPIKKLFYQSTLKKLFNGKELAVNHHVIKFDAEDHALHITNLKSPNDITSIVLNKKNQTIVNIFHHKEGDHQDITLQQKMLKFMPIFKAIEPILAPGAIEKTIGKPIKDELKENIIASENKASGMPKGQFILPGNPAAKSIDNSAVKPNLLSHTLKTWNEYAKIVPNATSSTNPVNTANAITPDLLKPATPNMVNINEALKEINLEQRNNIKHILTHGGSGGLPGDNIPHIPKGRGH